MRNDRREILTDFDLDEEEDLLSELLKVKLPPLRQDSIPRIKFLFWWEIVSLSSLTLRISRLV